MDFRVLTDLGVRARDQGLHEEAEAFFRRAVAQDPNHHFPWLNLGALLCDEWRFTEAEPLLRRALEIAPDDWRPASSLGMCLLGQGRYAEGWPLHERRLVAPLPRPAWTGEDVSGKRLIVWAEQGFGDAIMCARYLPDLARRADQVIVACRPELAPLIAQLGVQIALLTNTLALPPADLAVPVFSLPMRFATTLENMPPPAPFRVQPRRIGARIGLKLSGSPTHRADRWRSLPPADADRLRALPDTVSLDPSDSGARDFLETAEIIAGLDLVVSVDTSVAHLAGSLGVPTWILLPKRGADWRWLSGRRDSPWYPSVRLWRQERAGDWAPVVSAVCEQLQSSGYCERTG